MKCFRKIFNITFRDYITNNTVKQRIAETKGHKEEDDQQTAATPGR